MSESSTQLANDSAGPASGAASRSRREFAMAHIIPRYLTRHFVQTLAICFLSLIGLYIVIDALGHLEQFARHAKKGGNLLTVIGEFYGYQALGFFDRMSGVLALAAAMFTVAALKRGNELTALLAAGIPRTKILAPILIAAGGIALLAAANRELLLPAVRTELLRTPNTLDQSEFRSFGVAIDPTCDVVLRGRRLSNAQRVLQRPMFSFPALEGLTVTKLTAETGRWVDATSQHPRGWILQDIQEPAALLTQPSYSYRDQLKIGSPHDQEWLAENEIFVAFDVPYQHLASGSKWQDYASTNELIQYVRSSTAEPPTNAQVALHGRLVRPLLDFSLVLLGLPLLLSSRARSPFLAAGLAIGLVGFFMLTLLSTEFLGRSGWISPSLSAWLPMMVFVPPAFASARGLNNL